MLRSEQIVFKKLFLKCITEIDIKIFNFTWELSEVSRKDLYDILGPSNTF